MDRKLNFVVARHGVLRAAYLACRGTAGVHVPLSAVFRHVPLTEEFRVSVPLDLQERGLSILGGDASSLALTAKGTTEAAVMSDHDPLARR